ncbi:MAG: hypothetical protein CBC29_00390 [Methylococcaceae bacterium TMED69]|nr:MAG: hypothetical protein CBC29_00390 [Methylococcaceae bacterium TMED69]|tara:strand:+ start:2900 stop:3577 length:678 start_codon:yes stop_codon:yes gene_type:complete
MNKPIVSNFLALAVLLFSFIDTPISDYCFSVGMFALSGGITNWLAIHMLFEKIPFIMGSGVIEIQFKEFKKGIRQLILQEFFTKKNIETIYEDLRDDAVSKINVSFDKNEIFNSFIDILEKSSLSKTLEMFGGAKILEPLREPLVEKFQQILIELINKQRENNYNNIRTLEEKVTSVIDNKLNELTPERVKEIIQEMISQHLGWLVVWGAVFGGIIGLIFSISTK